jgi:hypothetical protein
VLLGGLDADASALCRDAGSAIAEGRPHERAFAASFGPGPSYVSDLSGFLSAAENRRSVRKKFRPQKKLSPRNAASPKSVGGSVAVSTRIVYFAYGSNMVTERLRERAPSATPIGIGRLSGHVLSWDKRSRSDGSGKCDAEATGRNGDVVWGVLFELDPRDKPALDRAEGAGEGYVEKQVTILTADGSVHALTYCATEKDPALRPYRWYKALVVAGAREHHLPADYRRRLELVETVSDLHWPARA